MNLKAGEEAVSDESIIDGPYPSLSNEVRTAVQLIVVPKETQLINYY